MKNRRLSFLTGKSSSYSFNQLLPTYLLKFSPTLIFMCQGSESKTGSICYFNWTRNFLAVIRAIATNLTFHGFFVKLIIRPFWDFNWLYVYVEFWKRMIVICHPGYGSRQIKPLSNFSFFTLSSHDDLFDVDSLILFKENTNWKFIFFSVSELEPEPK